MSDATRVSDLFDFLDSKLDLDWVAGRNSAEQIINTNIAWGASS